MKQKMQYLRLFCGKNKGNRGFVFTLDATIASIIVISTLIVASAYVSKPGEGALPELQLLNTGYDIMNIISQTGLWTDSSANALIGTFLPQNYNLIIKRQCGTSDLGWYELARDPDTIGSVPQDKAVVTGDYVFVKSGPVYCRARFYIWIK